MSYVTVVTLIMKMDRRLTEDEKDTIEEYVPETLANSLEDDGLVGDVEYKISEEEVPDGA